MDRQYQSMQDKLSKLRAKEMVARQQGRHDEADKLLDEIIRVQDFFD